MTAMFSLTKRVRFCYGHRLLGHKGKCRHLHGHNGSVEVTLEAPELDSTGMVADFGSVAQALERIIDEDLDHRTLLCEKDPLVEVLRREGEPVLTLPGDPTAENLARHVFGRCRGLDIPVRRVRFWETPTSSAAYSE